MSIPTSPSQTSLLLSTTTSNLSDRVNTSNLTSTSGDELLHDLWLTVFLAVLAGLVSLVTIFGNLIVLLAFGLERTIRQPTNYFLASLAVSDLLIGIFSMPLYTQVILIHSSDSPNSLIIL